MNLGRMLLLACGFATSALGLAGLVLPVLPATPFFLAAAWSFSKSSPRLEQWLYDLPVAGSGLRLWRQHGAIGKRAKVMAIGALGLSALMVVLQSPPAVVKWPVLAVILAIAIFLVSRSPGPEQQE